MIQEATAARGQYESSGLMGSFWIVDDPSTSNLPGLLNLILDIFVISTIFFISGYFTPSSLERQGAWRFVKSKFRRLMVPWMIAVFTLMPLYKMIFLYSRGLPQESWTTYFHFTNGIFSMSWLWFLPVLFLFDVSYLLLRRLNLPTGKIPLSLAVAAVFVLSMSYSMGASVLGWIGWPKKPLVDFQNERLLPYFLVFLLGSLCYRRGVFDSDKRNMKLYVAVNATAWIPINVYAMTLLNFIFRPGEYLISERAPASSTTVPRPRTSKPPSSSRWSTGDGCTGRWAARDVPPSPEDLRRSVPAVPEIPEGVGRSVPAVPEIPEDVGRSVPAVPEIPEG